MTNRTAQRPTASSLTRHDGASRSKEITMSTITLKNTSPAADASTARLTTVGQSLMTTGEHLLDAAIRSVLYVPAGSSDSDILKALRLLRSAGAAGGSIKIELEFALVDEGIALTENAANLTEMGPGGKPIGFSRGMDSPGRAKPDGAEALSQRYGLGVDGRLLC